jgi:hypothetical protein
MAVESSVVTQSALFDTRAQALEAARAAVRRARERELTAVPEPSLPGPGPRPLKARERTIGAVTRGRVAVAVPSHGTRARYNQRGEPCRCEACKAANARYMRGYRHRPTGPSLPLAGRGVADVDVKGRVL